MKRIVIILILFLSSCAPLDPVEIDGEPVRYCNDPLLEEGESCIVDDRGLFLGGLVGSIVFISTVSSAGYYLVNKKRDS